MNNVKKILDEFERNYFMQKGYYFYKPKHREFLYDCIVNNIYNTELILTFNWIKPVSRFIADKKEHINYLQKWCKEKWLFLWFRELKKIEIDVNINPNINYIIYIWKNKDDVNKALNYDDTHNWNIWELLWYPKCCSEKWISSNILKWNNNKIFEEYIECKNKFLLNNPFFNFTSNSLTFFYPCSLDCQKALDIHKKYAEIIKDDNLDFYNNLKSYFSLPILFLFPEKNNVLTDVLHYDEIFRIFFVWIIKDGIILYKDFFILSYAFLDQNIDEDYKKDSYKLLEKLIYGNKVYIKQNFIIIKWNNNYEEKFEIKNKVKIINFSENEL